MPLRGERPDEPTYEIVGDLPGGKARIVVANHRIFGRRCVQKIVDLHGTTGELAFQEPRLLDRITHPRITPIGEVQFDPDRKGAVTFIMPLYEGGSVDLALQSSHRFSLHESLAIIRDVLDAIAYLHTTMGYIHRDMKPGNVLMPIERNRGFVTDFGSAARIEADDRVPARLGTLMYLPPEARTDQRLGPQADVYGTALTLYEMLNGRIEWEKLTGLDMQVRLSKGRRAIPDSALSRWEVQVPDALRRAVRKGVHADSARRYQTPREFLVALQRIRCADWRRVDGQGLDGEWTGTWPPDIRPDRRLTFRVTS